MEFNNLGDRFTAIDQAVDAKDSSESFDNLKNETSSQSKGLDYSTIDSPLGDLAGFNLKGIEEDNQTFNNNLSTQSEDGALKSQNVTTQTTTPPGKVVVNSMEEARALYKKQVGDIKQSQKLLPIKFLEARDPRLAAGEYEFDQYATNVDRYRGYGKDTFNKLGFNPFIDPEKYYNENTSNWQDAKRMFGQFVPLFGSAFTSNWNTAWNFATGKSAVDFDEQEANDYERAMKIGSSSKGGVFGFANNLSLNMAYTTGIISNILVEEAAIWAGGLLLSPETGGASLAGSAELQEVENVKIASQLNRLRQHLGNVFRARQAGEMGKGALTMLKSFKNVENAREFWSGFRAGGAGLARGFGRFINPLEETAGAIKGIRLGEEGYRNLTNFAKASRTFGGFYRDVRNFNAAVGESQLEGGGVYNDILNEKIENYKKEHDGEVPDGKTLRSFYADAEAAGKLDAAINIPLILLSNKIVFDGIMNIKGVKPLIEASESALGKGAGKNFMWNAGKKVFVDGTKVGWQAFKQGALNTGKAFINPKVYGGIALNYFKENFVEGAQESLQDLTSGSIKNYYRNIYTHPALGGSNLIKSSIYQSLGEDVFSMKGLETFGSGFLMGGGTQVVGKSLKFVLKGSANLFNKQFRPEYYQNYMAQRDLIKTRALESLTAIANDPEKFFSTKNESLSTQIATNNIMSEAESNKDDKTHYDTKDIKTFDHVYTALNNGTFTNILDHLNDLSKLSDDELAAAFNMEKGSPARAKLQEYIGRANQIKERYDEVNENITNPFNPARFKKGSQAQIDEFIAYKGFEDAKKLMIFSQNGFERSIERMTSLFEDITKSSPLAQANASDFIVLQSENNLKDEINILKKEVELLSQGSAEEKRLAKLKDKKLESLKNFLSNLKEYNKNKEPITTDAEGNMIVPYNKHLLDPLRNSFDEYIRIIAKMNGQHSIFDDKINAAFDKLTDYYNLDEDSRKYADIVNKLSDPSILLRHAQKVSDAYYDMFENREELLSESIDNYINIYEFNNLMQALGSFGVIINPEEVPALFKKGQMPSSYFDLKQNKVIDEKDARYPGLESIVKTYSSLVQDVKTAREEQIAAKQAEKAEQTPVEETPEEQPEEKPEVTKVVPGMEPELEARLRAAYDSWKTINDSSDVTFEEYIGGNYATPERIRQEYELEKQQKASTTAAKQTTPTVTPTPTAEPEKVEETPEAELVDEGAKQAQDIVNSIQSIKDLPDVKFENKDQQSTVDLLNLIGDLKVKSEDVLAMVEARRNELLKNIKPTDLEKWDRLTFADGRKGYVTKTTSKDVNVKIFGTPKGVVETISAADLSKNLTMVEKGKVTTKPQETTVETTPEDNEAIKASQDTMQEFGKDQAKIQELTNNAINNAGDNNQNNLDNLFNNLGCKNI